MAQSGYTPLQLYSSTTPSAVPLAANLKQGELAFNIPDAKLFYKNTSGVVTQLQTAGASGYSGYSGSGVSGYSGTSGYSGAVGTGTSGYSGYSGTPAPTARGLGLNGETWNNVLSSRSAGTTYTNTRGYPIMVAIGQSGQNAGVSFSINGSLIAYNYVYGGSFGAGTVTIIVPPGATYSANIPYSGSFDTWWELY